MSHTSNRRRAIREWVCERESMHSPAGTQFSTWLKARDRSCSPSLSFSLCESVVKLRRDFSVTFMQIVQPYLSPEQTLDSNIYIYISNHKKNVSSANFGKSSFSREGSLIIAYTQCATMTRSKAKQSETISKNRLWTRLRLSRMGEREGEHVGASVCALCDIHCDLSWLLFFGLCYCVLLFALCALLCEPWQPYDADDDNDNTTTMIIMITDARNTFKAPSYIPSRSLLTLHDISYTCIYIYVY